jgi:hypothetical protein
MATKKSFITLNQVFFVQLQKHFQVDSMTVEQWNIFGSIQTQQEVIQLAKHDDLLNLHPGANVLDPFSSTLGLGDIS